jgi:hypothetical protein
MQAFLDVFAARTAPCRTARHPANDFGKVDDLSIVPVAVPPAV